MILKNKFAILIVVLLCNACNSNEIKNEKPEAVEVPEMELQLQFDRFEHELFRNAESTDTNRILAYRNNYGEFFEIWLTRLSGVLAPVQKDAPASIVAANLYQYLTDRYIREVNRDCDSAFRDLKPLESQLTDIFKRYKVLFPEADIPRLVTYTSPFTSNVVAMDSVLGLGLHFYLGADYKYYPSLGLPQYMIRRFEPEFVAADLLKGWLDSEYVNDSVELNCLSQMLYQGKILYLTEVLAPEIPDTLLTGYTAQQQRWTEDNEYRIWTFLVENQVLYNTNVKSYIKFINDGKGTSGFPQEAPAKLGVYIGWQIIRSFMKNNPDITPAALMQLDNAQVVLAGSGYKPQR